jgi:hypothetical protein
VVDDFPAWLTYRVKAVIVFHEDLKIGIDYNHSSSGSRVSAADYSGKYRFDILAKGNSLGLFIGYGVYDYKQFRIEFHATIGAMFSTCDFTEDLQVNGSTQTDSFIMTSVSMHATPELAFTYRYGIFGAGLYGGYQFDSGGVLKLSGQSTTIKTNWTGFRCGVELSLRIPGMGHGNNTSK